MPPNAPARPPESPSPSSKETPLFLPSFDSSDSDSSHEEEPTRTEITPGPTKPTDHDTAQTDASSDSTSSDSPHKTNGPDDNGDDDGDDDGSGGDGDGDDDPVVCEYDIHITASQSPDLYIFQYPVRSKNKPYTKAENTCPLEARFKPKSGLVEVDVPVNVHVNYDEEKGRVWGDILQKAAKEAGKNQLAGGAAATGNKKRKVVRGEDDDDEEEEDVLRMDFADALKAGRVLNRQTLGSRLQPDNTKYMVGTFKDDRLHLTPINSTLQLRPQFHHVDTAVDAERAATKALRDASAPQKPQEARAVHLSVKNSDDPSSQLSNTMKALRMAEEEEWTKLHWIDQDTDDAWEIYEGSCLKNGEGGALRNVTGKMEYMEWLSMGKPSVKKVVKTEVV